MHQDYEMMDGGVSTPVYNPQLPDYPASYRSSIARPDEYIDTPAGVIIEGPEEAYATVEETEDAHFRPGKEARFRRETESRGFEVKREGVINEYDARQFEKAAKSRYASEGPKERVKKSMFESVSPFYSNNAFKKVQVTEEETGTQRVQVNAGYENPKITCVSGYNSCSGVLLKFVLTLHGTNELNTAQRGMPCTF